MIKYLFVISLVSCGNRSLAQIFELSEKVDSIPLYDNNWKFMAMVNNEYDKLIKQKVDTLLLYYPIEYSTDYAVIFWKKKEQSHSIAFYQYHPPTQKMGKEVLKNETLNKVNIKNIYDVFQNDQARTIDTTVIVSESNPIYCRFYFGRKQETTAGYKGWISWKIGLGFINAFAEEEYRIVKRELEKSGVLRMQ